MPEITYMLQFAHRDSSDIPEVILVSELVWTTLNAYLLDLDTYRREGVLQNATILQILELRTNESGAFARLAVLEIDYKEGLAVHLDAHTDFDISSSNLHSVMCFMLIFAGAKIVKKTISCYKSDNYS